MQEYFETLLAQMERSTVDSLVTMGLALHELLALCAQSILAQAEANSAPVSYTHLRGHPILASRREITGYGQERFSAIIIPRVITNP